MNIADPQAQLLIRRLRTPPARLVPVLESLGVSFGPAAFEAKGLRGVLLDLEAAATANDVKLGEIFRDVEARAALLALTEADSSDISRSRS